MTTIRNCNLPDELLYDVERDLWTRPEPDGSVSLGLTDVGQTRAGQIMVISFTRRALAGPVGRGESVAVIESAKWVGPVTSPVTGAVVETNQALLTRPRLINLDPYLRGWIVRIEPGAEEAAGDWSARWLRGPAAVERYAAKMALPFRSVAGVDEDFWCVHCNEWEV